MPCFFFNDTATTEIYTLSLHDALPIFGLDANPIAVPRLTVRPLKKDVTKLSEPVRVLKNEFFSARPEAEPTDAVNPRIRPLNSEPPIVNDPVKDLNHDIFSERLDTEPSDPLTFLAQPLT